MPAPTVILTWQEKESSDEGQTVPLILFWFTDGSVCLSKAVGFDRLSLFNYYDTPRPPTGTLPTCLRSQVEFPSWSRGPLLSFARMSRPEVRGASLHRGEKRKLFPMVDHEISNAVVDIN